MKPSFIEWCFSFEAPTWVNISALLFAMVLATTLVIIGVYMIAVGLGWIPFCAFAIAVCFAVIRAREVYKEHHPND